MDKVNTDEATRKGHASRRRSELDARVADVRRFNRFYTQRIGVLHERLLDSAFTLTEVRILFEVAHRDGPSLAEIARELDIDPAQMSRTVRNLEKRQLVTRDVGVDGRAWRLALTDKGKKGFATLDARASAEVARWLGALPASAQRRVVAAMRTIERTFDTPRAASGLVPGNGPARRAIPYVLRPPNPGDLGWVVQRHGALYAEEYGWDERFEGLVASVIAQFVETRDDKRQRCWIADHDGEPVGSVFVVAASESTAKLRLLLVEPSARGRGIGARLVDECIRFARQARYEKMQLWTNDVLVSARRIYEAAGFSLASEQRHNRFGPDLVGQTWELEL